ncbi:glycosyltransferase [Microbacterium sp. CCNWLW134]|uniref:glycosyltransferase n=1 Tax=Microbacterium sp. CCNWLW134 TaxID=3122064 RepID=UPI003010184D
MTATLRVMLDQVAVPTDNDLAEASRELARALVAGAPSGTEVEAIVPAQTDATALRAAVPGLAGVHPAALPRRELSVAVQLGAPTGIGAGMIHSPTLMAPLVRHDRVHNHDQTVVTVWDSRAWDAPGELPRGALSFQRAMIKRAAKHADAVVVPTHALARRIAGVVNLGERIRVIPGAAPLGFAVPNDEVGRRRELDLPEGFVLLAGSASRNSDGLAVGLAAVARSGVDLPVVVIDAPEGEEPAIADLAEAAGLPERRLHVRGALETWNRAAVFGAALAFLAPSRREAFPWRVVDALTLGVPVLAAASDSHTEVVSDGGRLVDEADDAVLGDALGATLAETLGSVSAAERLGVLAADRGRAFSWAEAADKVWHLHADL